MSEAQIYLTRLDYQRLNDLLRANLDNRSAEPGNLTRLQAEMKRARIVEPAQIPRDAVTLNSRVRLRDLDSGEEMEFSVVYPSAASSGTKTISVLAPIGTAIFGCRAGDTIECEMPAGARRMKVEDVLYQLESIGRYDL